MTRQDWIEQYTQRILDAWRTGDCPLGIAEDYARQVRLDLQSYVDDPLKRALIETSY